MFLFSGQSYVKSCGSWKKKKKKKRKEDAFRRFRTARARVEIGSYEQQQHDGVRITRIIIIRVRTYTSYGRVTLLSELLRRVHDNVFSRVVYDSISPEKNARRGRKRDGRFCANNARSYTRIDYTIIIITRCDVYAVGLEFSRRPTD